MKALSAVLVVLMLWAVGLFAFAARVAHSTPAPDPGRAQGIVALTGPSPARMTVGIGLLQEGHGQRLLISGVNRMNNRDDIRRAARAVAGPIYDCCVDLGFEAVDTIGNARETADWARARDYDQLIVVTADYHMPRALLELKGALPHARLTPYPVATAELNARAWWRNPHETRRLTLEYTKYLVILTREAVLGLGPRA
ncbi:MAG: YdcF family protein [Caulobacteraceae bacterium]|nr:YdcF family protein [Caulobacteraceae bacterium]